MAPLPASVSYETSLAAGPTAATYGDLDRVYDFFNERLFDGELPRCLITMQRHKGAYGYFCPERFGSGSGVIADEIALNPMHFAERGVEKVLSTLVHEQAHLWQQHFGRPSRNGYHNKEWGKKMKEIGLYPSSTGQPGGKETGQKVSHYIMDGGAYARAFADLVELGLPELFCDLPAPLRDKKKNASKTKFECPECGIGAWAKREAKLICGDCERRMECVDPDDEGGED